MSVKIARLEAENYKRLKAVDIRPDGQVVTISGRNAQGKSSVLDALWAALAGGDASRATQQPIRDGQDMAVVRLDLGDKIVTRRWTKDDAGTLTVEAKDGAKYQSPQKLLDSLVDKRAFDPLAFTRQSPREQVATLLSTVELSIDPAVLDVERKTVFERRTEIGRDVTRLEGQLAGMPESAPDLPDTEVSASELIERIQEANRVREARERAEREIKDLDTAIENAKEEARIKQRMKDELLESRSWLPEPESVEELQKQLRAIDEVNARVRDAKARKSVDEQLVARKEERGKLTAQLQQIEKRKTDALAQVEFPVPGLSFTEDGVTLNGIPFSQASSAEQLRVSVGLAMAANPDLRVLRIMDGSLLDSESMRIIEQLAVDRDYQVWVEVVDESGTLGVVIEDGQVAS